MVPWQMLEWIIGGESASNRFTKNGGDYWNGGRVLRYLRDGTSLGHGGRGPVLKWNPYIRKERCRTVAESGLHPAAKRAIRRDLEADITKTPERVYILTGEPMHKRHPEKVRGRWESVLADQSENARSETTRRVLKHMNGVPPRTQTKVVQHIPAAIEQVKARPYDVELDPYRWSYEVRQDRVERIQGIQRRFHLSVLQNIGLQHKQYYQLSSLGFTDRIFPANKSVLYLPSDVRAILCQDYYNIDLQSAHLNIAAWLWGAEEARKMLRVEGYKVWDDLMEHYGPLIREAYGHPEPSPQLRSVIKGYLKIALYSVVFGMPDPSVKAKLTENLCDLLPSDSNRHLTPGKHFARHPLIRSLLDARGRQAARVVADGGMFAADGGWIDIAPRVEIAMEEGRPNPMEAAAAKVLGTVAQSYEMELMGVLVDYEQKRKTEKKYNRFKIAFWLHDGAYVAYPESRNLAPRMKDLDQLLQQKADELGVLARFDYEKISPEL